MITDEMVEAFKRCFGDAQLLPGQDHRIRAGLKVALAVIPKPGGDDDTYTIVSGRWVVTEGDAALQGVLGIRDFDQLSAENARLKARLAEAEKEKAAEREAWIAFATILHAQGLISDAGITAMREVESWTK